MFSSSLVRQGRSSLAKTPLVKRCNAIGQLAYAVHRCPAAAAPGACRRQTAFTAAAPEILQESAVSEAMASCFPPSLLEEEEEEEEEEVSVVEQSRSTPRTTGLGFGTIAMVDVPTLEGYGDHLLRHCGPWSSTARSRAPQAGRTALRLEKRWFSAGPVDFDVDSDSYSDNFSDSYGDSEGDSSGDSDSDSEFESTLFATALETMEEPAVAAPVSAAAAAAAAAAAIEAPAPKVSKVRKPGKRRPKGGGETTSATQPAAEPGEAPAGAEAPSKKPSKARKLRKRRPTGSENPTPEPAAESSEAAVGAAAEAPGKKGKAKARKSHKRRPAGGESSPSSSPADTAAEPPESPAEGEGEGVSSISESRRADFERTRRAGVARRAQEGGRVPLQGHSSSEQEAGEASDGDGSSPFPPREAAKAPSVWQEPAQPVRPEGFLAEGTGNATGRKAVRQRKEKQDQHPVLGHLLADLGYKRVYVTSVDALTKADVWDRARTLRPVHAMEIFHAKKLEADKMEIQQIMAGEVEVKGTSEKSAKGMPGVVTLFRRQLLPRTKKPPKYVLGIVDGQHRLGALLLLAEEGLWDPSEQNVLVEVIDTKDDKEVQQLFAEINRAEPKKFDFDLPGPEEVQNCADGVVLHLYQEYRPMFGGKRVRPPSLHANTFKENMVASGMIERHELYDPDLLLDYLLRVNDMLSRRDMKMWEKLVEREESSYKSKQQLLAAHRKAKKHGFWLGMEQSWMFV